MTRSHSHPRRRTAGSLLAAAALLGVAACSGEDTGTAERASSAETAAPSPQPDEGSASPSPTASARTAPEDDSSLRLGTGWGPTPAVQQRATRLVRRLSLPELAGQVIVAHYDGTGAPTALVERLHLGGVIAFDANISSTRGIQSANRAVQRSARADGRRWPVFVGVDQEGGIVERVQGGATRFPTFMTAGAADRPSLTRAAARASGAEMLGLGFTVLFAPVGDVTSGPQDPTIGSRSAGSRPALVTRQMSAAVDGYLEAGVAPVIKHFPGHGSVPADSHEVLPVQRKSLRQLRRSDLVPFRDGVENGISSVMVAHLDVRAVDPGVPSSLSRKVVGQLLRREVGFQGLVVTDALNMGAITGRFSPGEAAVRALRAGADVALMPADPTAARDGIVAAVRSGTLARTRLEQAAARQVALLLHQAALEREGRPLGSARKASRRLSAAGVTVVAGRCRGRLVGDSVQVSGPADAVAAFRSAASRAGLGTGGGTRVSLIGYGGSGASGDVVVTLDTPYPLGSSSASRARIALYGDTPGAMDALVGVLTGRARATGTLPVPVPGVPRRGC